MSSSLREGSDAPAAHAAVGTTPLGFPAAASWFVTYLLIGAGVLLLQRETGASFWYPPVALGILIVSLHGWRAGVVVLLADTIVSSFQFGSPLEGLVVGASTLLEAGLAGALLARARVDLRLPDVRSLVRLFVLGAVMPTVIGVTHGSIWLLALGVNAPSSAFFTWLTWWLGDAVTTACLLPALLIAVVPLLIPAWHGERLGDLRPGARQTLMLVLVSTILCTLAFGWGSGQPDHLEHSLKYLCFLPVIWAAITLGVVGTSGMVAFVSTLAVILSLFNGSPVGLASVEDAPAVLDIQLFMFALSLGGMVLALSLEGERAARAASQRDAAALREREARLRQIAETVREVFWIRDMPGGQIGYVSPMYETIWGRSRQSLYEQPESLTAAVHPDDRARVEAAMADTAAGRVLDERLRVVRPDGSTRWLWLRGFPILDDTGRVYRTVGVAEDITEQRANDEELRAARALLASFVEHIPANVFVCDLDGTFRLVNRSWERFFRLGRDEVLGRRAEQLFAAELAGDFLATNRQVVERGDVITFDRSLSHDGQQIVVQMVKFPIRTSDGQVTGVAGIALDITARTRAELARRLLSAAQEQAGEGTVITDATGTILSVNPAFERVSGYGAAELVGRPATMLRSDHHDEAFYHQIWRVIAGGDVWRGRFVNHARDGREYTVEATIAPIRGAAGLIEHYVAVARDVTRELRLEAHFHQVQKMEAIGRLAGGIAHDFNNLLSVINGYSDLLLDAHPSPDDPVRLDVEPIREAGLRGARLTRQLLVFSRHQALQPEVLDLNRVLAETEQLLRRVIGEDIAVVTVTAPGLWPISADRGQLEQVIMNLVVNARDAMPSGGVLGLATSNVCVESVGGASEEFVRLEVSDTGVGMGDDVLEHLFEPFYTTKGPGRGSGLGLAIVHGIVTRSGGAVAVSSTPGMGTRFTVDLPRHRGGEPATGALVGEQLAGGTETILLVEDEAPIRTLAARVLRDHGYTVIVAAGGAEALSLCAGSTPIQLLLTDVVMPEMSGQELAAEARRRRPGLAVLYMSGYPDRSPGAAQAWEPDAPLLAKPITPASLCVAVRAVLDNHRLLSLAPPRGAG